MINQFINGVFGSVLAVALLATSCRPAKKIQTAVANADTSAVITIPKNESVDSAAIIKEIHDKVAANKIDFTTFSAKAKMDFIDAGGKKTDATLNIRIQKDSLIWVSITGALSIEGFRILVKPDTVAIMNKLEKEIAYKPVAALQEMIKLPVDFYTLQDLLIGNPVFLPETFTSVRFGEEHLNVVGLTEFFKSFIAINKNNNLVANMKLDDVIATRSRSCNMTYDGYEAVLDNKFFSTKREIEVREKSTLSVKLDFKNYTFNEEQTYPFTVPKSYTLIP